MRNQSITTVQREITLAELMYLLMMQCKQFVMQIRRYLSYYFRPRIERISRVCRDMTYQQCMHRYKVLLDCGDGDIICMSDMQIIKASVYGVLFLLVVFAIPGILYNL